MDLNKKRKGLEWMTNNQINKEILEINIWVCINNTDPDILEPMSELIQTWAGSHEGDVDQEGDIWISDPMNGHWVDIDGKKDFILFVESLDN